MNERHPIGQPFKPVHKIPTPQLKELIDWYNTQRFQYSATLADRLKDLKDELLRRSIVGF